MNNLRLNSGNITTEKKDNVKNAELNYNGFQIVRKEFFSHIYEPSISFSNCKVSVNMACLRKLPDVKYIQFLVNPNTKELILRPCEEDESDSFLWYTGEDDKRKPRRISCRIFFEMLFSHMNWNPKYRYKLLGKIIENNGDYIILFNLKATEVFYRVIDNDENKSISSFPEEWKNRFGIPVEEHHDFTHINILDEYTAFGVNSQNNKKE